MTRETGMATEADLKRIKHKSECPKLANGRDCAECKEYGFKQWRCPNCGIYGVEGKVEDHTCPGPQ